jgi:hypothetical protein
MSYLADPVALADQADAAQRDAERLFNRDAGALGMTVTEHDPSAWLTEVIHALMADIVDGNALPCAHLPRGPRPEYAAVWHPGRVVCRDCIRQLQPHDDAPGCDGCGDEPEFVTMHQVRFGTLTMFYALCDLCEALEDAETGPADSSVDQGAPGELGSFE